MPLISWPSLIVHAGAAAQERFLEFFAATSRNKNTRMAYSRAISRFLKWGDERHLELGAIALFMLPARAHHAAHQKRLSRVDVFWIAQRQAKNAGLLRKICNHSFQATDITAYMENGGELEKAARIARHNSPRTTQLYDHTADGITLEEIERIRF